MRNAACFVLLWIVVVGAAHAADENDARHVHALLVIDTNDPEIGESVKQDLNTFRQLLDWGIPEHRRSMTELQGDAAMPKGILAAIQKLDVKRNDALVVYYAGHGAWYDGGHYLRMNQGKILLRKDLQSAMRKRAPRLAILLTDCCSTYVGGKAFVRKMIYDPTTFRDLFFRHRGFVDVTAASKGQVAVGDRIQGGYFTSALAATISTTPREKLDANGDKIVAWDEVMPLARQATVKTFADGQPRGLMVRGRKHTRQTPHVFGALAAPVGVPIPVAKLRVGVELKDVPGGLEVTKVHEGSPAGWAGIRPGERIVSAMTPGEIYDEYHEVKKLDDLRRVLASVKGPEVITLVTHKPGEKDRWDNDKRRDRRVRLSR